MFVEVHGACFIIISEKQRFWSKESGHTIWSIQLNSWIIMNESTVVFQRIYTIIDCHSDTVSHAVTIQTCIPYGVKLLCVVRIRSILLARPRRMAFPVLFSRSPINAFWRFRYWVAARGPEAVCRAGKGGRQWALLWMVSNYSRLYRCSFGMLRV